MKWDKPQVLEDKGFGFVYKSDINALLPKWEEIPEEFILGTEHTNKWIKVIGHWFFEGIELTDVTMKEEIDKMVAICHIGYIMTVIYLTKSANRSGDVRTMNLSVSINRSE